MAFLLGHSLEAFGQWKALLHLVLACEEAPLQTRPQMYTHLLAALHAQLHLCLASGRFTSISCLATPSPTNHLDGFFVCLQTALSLRWRCAACFIAGCLFCRHSLHARLLLMQVARSREPFRKIEKWKST